MRGVLGGGIALLAVAGALLLVGPMRSEAKDYGQAGQAFPIIEPDLLSTIEARLRRAEASGELARMNDVFAKRVEAKVRRPKPVEGITPARTARNWDYDPTVAIERDIRDQKGNLIAAAGQKINPLDFVAIRQDLVFVDGDNAAELAWATARYTDLKAKIIFVSGSPIEQMTAKKRRFYFDQEGKLTGIFGIEHTPAVVTQAGKVMRVSEMVIKPGSPG
ncbi:IncF plasmid conjugative transfer pilus assembly protein TraW [Sphingobium indicum BiD32]|uniref:IncF plasmid conjugative transfer pilus assembly protein TraW n=1 Tax=Sphingobium indicum BiD32 TaxID=1301087 RepID=N1MJV6_9SPHN|nr:type-F conjugative transfer system protein TraW [Sphingobium indicum]CCW17226.1 IncF plasmid conjugative transfer pilus assembly protein TraW [Sphingobium indicum BiD32]